MKNEKHTGSEEELVCKMVEFLQSHDASILVSCVGEALYRIERDGGPKRVCTLKVELTAEDILKRFPELAGSFGPVAPVYFCHSGRIIHKCGNCNVKIEAAWSTCPICGRRIDWDNLKAEE